MEVKFLWNLILLLLLSKEIVLLSVGFVMDL